MEQTDLYPLADHCPLNYEEAREAFIDAACKNKQFTEHTSLRIQAKGPKQSELFIDIAVIGDLKKAKKILFHISGTHGVEGGLGSGIQHEFLSHPTDLKEEIAIVFIHALNPFGMAWNRRVNEENVDLNRNCVEERLTPELYGIIDPPINPKTPLPWDPSVLKEVNSKYGWPAVRKTLLGGQYHYPEGLFYGGTEIAEGPKLVLAWCLTKLAAFNGAADELYFGIIDVHSGLGPYGVDTLLTPDPPTELMVSFFGEKMAAAAQKATAGYKATGVFAKELEKCIQKATRCPSSHIFIIGEEFGTIPEEEMLEALYKENVLFHYAQRNGAPYDPDSVEGRAFLKAFYPEERNWRHHIVALGRTLLLQAVEFLDQFQKPMHAPFPIETPYEEGYLEVSKKHQIFYAVYGNPEGIPALILHGGPGVGCSDSLSRFFDLSRFKVVMFDQRGAMRSKPFACMEENTTQLSIEDIEALRKYLGIKQWVIFGGSWGSLLGVLYGQEHPEACLGFVLRGIFLGRKEDVRLFNKREEAPELYQEFLSHFSAEEQTNLLEASYRRVMDVDPKVHLPFSRAFLRFQMTNTAASPNHSSIESLLKSDQFVLSMARAVLHYASHELFLYPNQVLSQMDQIAHLPAVIVHGDADINCLPDQAELLHKSWKNSRLVIVKGGGHSADDPLISSALISATETFADTIVRDMQSAN